MVNTNDDARIGNSQTIISINLYLFSDTTYFSQPISILGLDGNKPWIDFNLAVYNFNFTVRV